MPQAERIAIVGAGAIGSFVGARLALAGRRVVLIGRAAHVQAMQSGGLQLHSGGRQQTVAVDADTAMAAAAGAGLVLVCVKSGATAAVAAELAAFVAPDALVLSLQNGVTNVATLAQLLRAPVAAAVAYAATALPAPGVVAHHGGDEFVLGASGAHGAALRTQLDAAAALLQQAGLRARVVEDALPVLWAKLVVNCAINAASALARAPYAAMAASPAMRALQHAAADEALAVALAEGLVLDREAVHAAVDRIAVTMPAQRSSTAQDLARGRPTEVDHLNGHVVQRGAALGVATPVNHTLWALVRLAEAQAPAGS